MNKLVAIINYNYFLIPTLNENNLSDFSITQLSGRGDKSTVVIVAESRSTKYFIICILYSIIRVSFTRNYWAEYGGELSDWVCSMSELATFCFSLRQLLEMNIVAFGATFLFSNIQLYCSIRATSHSTACQYLQYVCI